MSSETKLPYKKLLHNPLVILFFTVNLYLLTSMAAAILAETFGISLENASNVDLFWFSSIRLIVFFFSLSLVLAVIKKDWRIFGLRRPRAGWLKKLPLAYLAYLAAAFLLFAVIQRLIPEFNLEQTQDVGFSNHPAVWQIALAGTSLVLMTPLLEEILFRGIFFLGLRKTLNFWVSSIVVSLVFAAAHGQWNVALDTFVLSMVACWLVEKTGSIWPAILLHVVKNGVAFLLLFVI